MAKGHCHPPDQIESDVTSSDEENVLFASVKKALEEAPFSSKTIEKAAKNAQKMGANEQQILGMFNNLPSKEQKLPGTSFAGNSPYNSEKNVCKFVNKGRKIYHFCLTINP